jgi:hypothetical protein
MFWVQLAALLFGGFFVIILPGGILAAAVLVNVRRKTQPAVQLCSASDVTDPASTPCFAFEGTAVCERHGGLQQAS